MKLSLKSAHPDPIERFTDWACEELHLHPRPRVRWYDNPLKGPQPSFASYNPTENEICVCRAGRHPVDVMRSLAHELFHAFQNQRGALRVGDGATGTPIENQANTIAGILVRKWGRQNPEVYSLGEATEGDSMVQAVLRRFRAGRPAERQFISLNTTGRRGAGESEVLSGLKEMWREDLLAVFKKLGLDRGWGQPLTYR